MFLARVWDARLCGAVVVVLDLSGCYNMFGSGD
jgi:hypothetical protein